MVYLLSADSDSALWWLQFQSCPKASSRHRRLSRSLTPAVVCDDRQLAGLTVLSPWFSTQGGGERRLPGCPVDSVVSSHRLSHRK